MKPLEVQEFFPVTGATFGSGVSLPSELRFIFFGRVQSSQPNLPANKARFVNASFNLHK